LSKKVLENSWSRSQAVKNYRQE